MVRERRGEALVWLMILGVALAYTSVALRYGVGIRPLPEAGLVPTLLGITLTAMSAWGLFLVVCHPAQRNDGPASEPVNLRRILQLVALLVAYVAFLDVAGFPFTTFAAVLLGARLMGLGGMVRPLLLAVGTVVVAQVVFVVGLGVPLPPGHWPGW